MLAQLKYNEEHLIIESQCIEWLLKSGYYQQECSQYEADFPVCAYADSFCSSVLYTKGTTDLLLDYCCHFRAHHTHRE